VCHEHTCPLRSICNTTWENVKGSCSKADSPQSAAYRRRKKKRKVKFVRKKKKKEVVAQVKRGFGRINVKYVHSGRPVDVIAEDLWEFLGKPSKLPIDFRYPSASTPERKDRATTIFKKRYGKYVRVSMRYSYHRYFVHGEPLMKLWFTSVSAAWVELSEYLASLLLSLEERGVFPAKPNKHRPKQNRLLPFKFKIANVADLDRIKAALKLHESLAYIWKDETEGPIHRSREQDLKDRMGQSE